MLSVVTMLAQEVREKAKLSQYAQPVLAKFALGVADSILGKEEQKAHENEEDLMEDDDCCDSEPGVYDEEVEYPDPEDDEEDFEDEEDYEDDEEEEDLSSALDEVREAIEDLAQAVPSPESLSSRKTFKGIRPYLVKQFKKYHAENPHVYSELHRIGENILDFGSVESNGTVSVRTLIEVAKYEAYMSRKPLKISNNHASLYARLLMANNERFGELFRIRR